MVCQSALLNIQSKVKPVNIISGSSCFETSDDINGEPGMRVKDHKMKGIRCVWIFTGKWMRRRDSERKSSQKYVRVSLCTWNNDMTIRGHSARGINLYFR